MKYRYYTFEHFQSILNLWRYLQRHDTVDEDNQELQLAHLSSVERSTIIRLCDVVYKYTWNVPLKILFKINLIKSEKENYDQSNSHPRNE